MKKILVLVLCSFCLALCGCGEYEEINQGRDVLYKETVYIRSEFPNYNIELVSDDEESIGVFVETYENGATLPWDVFLLNEEECVLYSHHALWLKPNYKLPDEYGESFSKVEYVISEGILDEYKEETTHLCSFEGEVTLEDIISKEAAVISDYTQYADLRFYYADHKDIAIRLGLVSSEGEFYLSVRRDYDGADVFYKINDKYIEDLTSAINKK